MSKKGIDAIAKEKLNNILAKIDDPVEIKIFLSDILSSSEIKDIARRLLAADYLFHGKTYEKVNYDLGMGMATINKVNFKTRGSHLLKKLLTD